MRPPTDPAIFYDLPALLDLHAALESLDPAGPPQALALHPPGQGERATGRRAAVLPGSFNPFHLGHVELAAVALADEGADEVWFGLSQVTVDKEQVTGACLEDRLLVLRHSIRESPRYGVALFNRGLYVEQARAAHTLWPDLDELLFLVGFDKIVQVFDPRYYDDRDTALRQLFSLAVFLVAPRVGATERDLAELLAVPANQPFADGVRYLPLPTSVRQVSSTAARRTLATPEADRAAAALAATATALVEATGAYATAQPVGDEAVDRYALRRSLLAALFRDRDWALAHANLRTLMAVAVQETPAGHTLRAALEALDRPLPPDEMRRVIQAVQESGQRPP